MSDTGASIFISHASQDRRIAESLCASLEGRGFHCWLASRDVGGGENFASAIVRAIRAAKVMLLVFTANANNSDEIKKELVLASQNRLVVIPLRVEDIAPEDAFAYELATRQWIDLFDDWERGLERVAARIAAVLPAFPARRPLPSPPDPPDRPRDGLASLRWVLRAIHSTTHARPAAEAPEIPSARNARATAAPTPTGTSRGAAPQPAARSRGIPLPIADTTRPAGTLAGAGGRKRAWVITSATLAITLAAALAYRSLNGPTEPPAVPAGPSTPPLAPTSMEAAHPPGKPSVGGAGQTRHRAPLASGTSDTGAPTPNPSTDSIPRIPPSAPPMSPSAPPITIDTANRDAAEAMSREDYEAALAWYGVAADQGDAAAQNNVGWLRQHGWGNPQDYAAAMDWYRKAAGQGYAAAQYNIGWLYSHGQGVQQDYAEAMRWYRKAADQGNVAAQIDIGALYQNGWGVPQDYAAAMRWYHKAADQGDAPAQRNIGTLYENGWGVPQDYAEAMRWYRKAADQGDVPAELNVARMYEVGIGVAKDLAQARAWMQKAAAGGDPSAKEWLAIH
jgi:TPR repeat protein